MSSENELGAAGTPLLTPPPPQVPRRHPVRNVVLTVLGVIVLGFVAFMALGFYELHKNAGSAQAGVAPATTAAAPASTPDLGIPVYPGAALTAAGVQTTVSGTYHPRFPKPRHPVLSAATRQQRPGHEPSECSHDEHGSTRQRHKRHCDRR
jgi:hypothetical protein